MRLSLSGLCLAAAILMTGPVHAERVIHIGNGGDPETLDPHRLTSSIGDAVVRDLCEGLVALDASAQVIPGLAERWTVSSDGKTYTFTLRPGLKWSDGSPFAADDFVWSMRRAVAPETLPGFPEFLHAIENAREIGRGEMPPESLGVSSPDPRTVVIRLWRPFPDFLGFGASQRGMFPLQRSAVEAHKGDFVRPGRFHCTGPFILAEAVPQSHVRLVRNPHYWDAANVRLDAVVYHSTEDANTELKRFRAGELHITNTIPATQVDWLKAHLPENLRIVQAMNTYYYLPNLGKEPWAGKPALRRALALAVDREALVRRVSRGGEVPAYTITPPGGGYDPPRPDWADWTQARRIEEARRLFAEAGYGPGNPLRIEILYNTLDRHRQVAIAVSAMWKQALGVEVTLNNIEGKVLLARLAEKSFQDLVRRTWNSPFPFGHLDLLRSTAQPTSSVGYSNPAFDRLMAEADAIADPAAYRAKMREAEALALADMPLIPLMHETFRRLVAGTVRGYVDNSINVHPARFLWLEETPSR
ncbi:MAG TPA: peptide ABC transporter substrate-binding protein [Azospirillaceae bacterium]|nr:peptide ABC transporter substrate-binding protein [Azospirillaceae bacterium]